MINSNVKSPERRAKMITMLALVPLGYAFTLLSKVWYHFSFQSNKLILPDNYLQIKNVSAEFDLTSFDLMANNVVKSFKGVSPALTKGAFGLPNVFIFLVVSLALACAALYIESSLLALVALYVANLSRVNMNQMVGLVENPTFGGSYMTQTYVIQSFFNCAWIMMTLFGVLALQIRYIKKAKNESSQLSSIFETVMKIQKNNIFENLKISSSEKETTKV